MPEGHQALGASYAENVFYGKHSYIQLAVRNCIRLRLSKNIFRRTTNDNRWPSVNSRIEYPLNKLYDNNLHKYTHFQNASILGG